MGAVSSYCCPSRNTPAEQGGERSDRNRLQSTAARSESRLELGVDNPAHQGGDEAEAARKQSGLPPGVDTTAQQEEDESEASSRQTESQLPVGEDTPAQQREGDLEAISRQSESQHSPVEDTTAQHGEVELEATIAKRQTQSALPLEVNTTAAQQENDVFEAANKQSDLPPGVDTTAQQGGGESEAPSRQTESQLPVGEDTEAQRGEGDFKATSRQTESQFPLETDNGAQQGEGDFEATSGQPESRVPLGKDNTAQQGEVRFEATMAKRQTESQRPLREDTAAQQGEDESEATSRQTESQLPVEENTAAQQKEEDFEATSGQSEVPSIKKDNDQSPESVKKEAPLEGDSHQRVAPRKQENTLMSPEDRELLDEHRVELVEHIGLEDGVLLALLRAEKAISRRQEEEIKVEGANASQVGCLLDWLQRGDSATMAKFTDCLQRAGQASVVTNWLQPLRQTIDGTEDPLSEEDQDMLERARPKLMIDLDLTGGYVLSMLRARDVLTASAENEIKETKPNSNAVGTLIDHLLRKSSDSLEQFLHTLKMCRSEVLGYLRQPTTDDTYDGPIMFGGESTKELQDALRHNLKIKLEEWKSKLETRVSGEREPEYIDQPCLVNPEASIEHDELSTEASKQQLVDTIKLIEDSNPSDRFIIYGEAGMGKTTLLRQLARSWINEGELKNKFAFVFLIPLRRVGTGKMLNVICDELGLVHESSLKDLETSLGRCEHQVLFLLDSYEELREYVIEAKKTGINDLINGLVFSQSTVVITSRPDTKLQRSKDQKTAHLKDLPENKVKDIIKKHFDDNEDAVEEVLESFPSMSFLQRPINLALFLYVATEGNLKKGLAKLVSQVELLNQVLQYLMVAFAKKRSYKGFVAEPGSYLKNKNIPRDILRLFRDIAKTCYEERRKNTATLHIQNEDDRKDYLDFGLFTEGPGINSIALPHPLFQEFFSAAYLAENPDAWMRLFQEIKEESERKSPRTSLAYVVRPMGLENVLRFLIALSPQPQLEQVCLQVGSLFVVEREKIHDDCDTYKLVSFEYYTELIRDCSDESAKRVLATALLSAQVRDVKERPGYSLVEDRSHVLLHYLDYEQCARFLKKVHNIDLGLKAGKSTLSCTGDDNRLWIRDKLVVAVVNQYNCIIKADELDIRSLHLPVTMLTRIDVHQLRLWLCTLCEGLPDYMSGVDTSVTSQHPLPSTNSSLKKVKLCAVKGLELCDVMTSCQCQLEVYGCGDIRLSALKTLFPKVSELMLDDNVATEYTTLVCETEEELTSWLSSVDTVRRLQLAPAREGESLSLFHLLNILSGRTELMHLGLFRYTPLLDVIDSSETVKQNYTVSRLQLEDCKGDIDLGLLLEIGSRQCPWLRTVSVRGCQLRVNVRDTNDPVNQNKLLSALNVERCKGDVDLGQLLEVCGRQCPQLKRLSVWYSNVILDYEKVESITPLPGLQKLTLIETSVHTPAGQRLSKKKVKQHICRLCPSAEIGYPVSDSESDSGSESDPQSGAES